MRARRLSVLLASVALTGCTQTVHGTAVARFTLPVDDFPTTAGYTAVDSDSFYIRDGNPEYGFVFTAPNGLVCGMGSFPAWGSAGAECTGSRPDRGPGILDGRCGTLRCDQRPDVGTAQRRQSESTTQ